MTEQRTAIVTGAASGLGRSIAERFGADGRNVALFDLNIEAATAAAAGIEEHDGGRATVYRVDVTDRAGIEAAVADVATKLGPPTILVNDAGLTGFQPFLEITLEDWNACSTRTCDWTFPTAARS